MQYKDSNGENVVVDRKLVSCVHAIIQNLKYVEEPKYLSTISVAIVNKRQAIDIPHPM